MNLDELRERCDQAERASAEAGNTDNVPVILVIRRPSPPTGRRLRVLPGVMGDIANWQYDDRRSQRGAGRVVVYVQARDVRAYIAKAESARDLTRFVVAPAVAVR